MKIVDTDTIFPWTFENLFYSREWLNVLSDCYGFTFSAILEDDGTPLMIFCIIEDIFGKRLISLPFSDYTDPNLNVAGKMPHVLNYLKDQYPGFPITMKLLGDQNLVHEGFIKNRNAVCHRIPLNGNIDVIWQRTSHSFRKGVNKAIRSGLTFEISNTEEGLESFYALLVDLRKKKYRILPQSKDFYGLLLKHFCNAEKGYFCFVKQKGKPVASAVILRSGSMLFDKMGVSDVDFQEYRPNNLLLWEVMKLGNSTGASALDMGLTQSDHNGLIKFKDSLGGFQLPISYHRFNPPEFDHSREQSTKLLLKKITDYIIDTELSNNKLAEAGAILYKFFC